MGDVLDDILKRAFGLMNPDGPEAIAERAAQRAANLDGNPYPGDGRSIRTGPGHVTFTMATEVEGWNFKPDDGLGRLVRARDGADLTAASDERLWPKQILDWEHREKTFAGALSVPLDVLYGKPGFGMAPPAMEGAVGSTEWPEAPKGLNGPAGPQGMMPGPLIYQPYSQDTEEALRRALLSILGDMPSPSEDPWERCRGIAAEALGYQKPEPMERPDGRPWPPPAAEIPVRFIGGGVYDPKDSERYCCHLIWWPDELKVPFFEGEQGSRTLHLNCQTSGAPTYYDIGFDERRPVTQEIVDNMERGIQRLIAERHEMRADKDAEIILLRQALAAKDARIGELKSVLASTPVAFEDPDAKPPPAHNPFREFPRDQRRMGP